MIISVHLPKTVGTSFIKTLKTLCDGEIVKDYSDKPLNRKEVERKIVTSIKRIKNSWMNLDDIGCIHGHFMPHKYLSLNQPTLFITWLRDPVERLASHYYFWINHYNAETAFRLQRKVVEENWSFEQFAFSKEMQNVYDKFLWNFPMKKFDFIGITEYYQEDLTYFSKKYFNREPKVFEENINPQNPKKYITNKALRKDIERFHKEDMKLYNQVLQRRKKRVNE